VSGWENIINLLFFWYSAVLHSRSMTPITWQAAFDDEEQRPLLQDILEAAVDDRGRRQLTTAAATVARHLRSSHRWESSMPVFN